jgi:hypothetical protein
MPKQGKKFNGTARQMNTHENGNHDVNGSDMPESLKKIDKLLKSSTFQEESLTQLEIEAMYRKIKGQDSTSL